MLKRNTKEKILHTALKLFSEKGYDGVGVREIAREVGIRESALYKHYSSKQEIFDSIIIIMSERYEQEITTYQLSEQISASLTKSEAMESLIKMCTLQISLYMKDTTGCQLRRLLAFEQVKNTELGKKFSRLILDGGLDQIAAIFTELVNSGSYRKADPYVMAIQFYSPIYLLINQYDHQPGGYEKVLEFFEKHVMQFDILYRKEDDN